MREPRSALSLSIAVSFAAVATAFTAACGAVAPNAVDAPMNAVASATAPAAATADATNAAKVDAPNGTVAARRPELEDTLGAPELEAAQAAIRAGDWTKARVELERVLPSLEGKAPLDVELAAEALLGRACAKLGDAGCSRAHYDAVVSTYASGWEGGELPNPDTATPRTRAARTSMALAEAYYQQAEAQRIAADEIIMPVYSGNGEARSVRAFIEERVAPYVKTKLAALEKAEASYQRIFSLDPRPARWRVDASSRIGQAYGRFTAEFRAAPIPADWKKSGGPLGSDLTWEDVRTAYFAALDEASEPLRQRAKKAFEACAVESGTTGWVDDLSRQCDQWLEKNGGGA